MRKHALIVHPDNSACILMENWARREGYSARSVRHGDEAVMLAMHDQVDLIILDRDSPGSECFDVILGLMRDPQASRIPVVFVNADADALPIVATSRLVH